MLKLLKLQKLNGRIEPGELQYVLKGMINGKTAGDDNFPSEWFKMAKDNTESPMFKTNLRVMNVVYDHGKVSKK